MSVTDRRDGFQTDGLRFYPVHNTSPQPYKNSWGVYCTIIFIPVNSDGYSSRHSVASRLVEHIHHEVPSIHDVCPAPQSDRDQLQ